ncbi:CRISPR-associated endonuclease Cas2 [Elioraea thermophila]|uniref:CRISPR-associated endonuclease Cas2 n=1 Tax=Elioraea thermophila TaxID=2185104 RepID=UPI000DF2FEC5|nr:CRISPR-associated endonuclease Cas2 [Elioraea thermophila]
MPERVLFVFAYDITSPKRLRRALHACRAFASGGQKSAHECFLTEAERFALLRRLDGLIHPRHDRLIALRLDPRSPPRCLGIARPPRDQRVLIIA